MAGRSVGEAGAARVGASWLLYAELAFAMFLWGALYPASKPVLLEVPSTHIALARAVIGFLVLGGIVFARGKGGEAISELRARPWASALLGVISFTITSMLAMSAMMYLPASVGGLLINTSPLWLSLAAVIVIRPPDSKRMLLGATVALVGVALVFSRDGSLAAAFSGGGLDPRGVALALANSVAIAANNVLARKIMPGRDPIVMTALGCAWGALPLFLIVGLNGGTAPYLSASAGNLALLLFIGVGCTAVNFALFNHAIKRVPAERATTFQYLSPLVSALLAFAFLGESITVGLVVGGVAILGGIALSQERPESAARGKPSSLPRRVR